MAQAQTISFGKVVVLLSDMQTPTPIFSASCGVEELTMTINIESNTTNAPDCDDPDLPGWLESDIVSKQMTIQGNGVLDLNAIGVWNDWAHNELPATEIQVRFMRDISGPGGGYYQGRAILTAYEETGQRGNKWRNTFTITFSGKPTWVSVT